MQATQTPPVLRVLSFRAAAPEPKLKPEERDLLASLRLLASHNPEAAEMVYRTADNLAADYCPEAAARYMRRKGGR